MIKMRWLLVSSLSVLALAACSGAGDTKQPESNQSASAQTQGDSTAARKAGPDPAQFIKRFDADGNGTLEVAELPPRMQKWLAKADTNQDGKLDAAELQANAEQMKKEHFARMDKNHDGALTTDDVGDKRWQRLSAADENKDGKVTEAELDKAFQGGKLGFGPGPGARGGWMGGKAGRGGHGERGGPDGKARGERMFERFDADKDGALTQAEVGEKMWAHISVADADNDAKVTREELKAAHESGKLQRMKGPRGGQDQDQDQDQE
jgi:Ca2+-binding EF-hand superfamily protein